jgi:hypothetical protein
MAGSVNKVIIDRQSRRRPGGQDIPERRQGLQPLGRHLRAVARQADGRAPGEAPSGTASRSTPRTLVRIAEQLPAQGLQGLSRGPARDPQVAGPVRPGPLHHRDRTPPLPRRDDPSRPDAAKAAAAACRTTTAAASAAAPRAAALTSSTTKSLSERNAAEALGNRHTGPFLPDPPQADRAAPARPTAGAILAPTRAAAARSRTFRLPHAPRPPPEAPGDRTGRGSTGAPPHRSGSGAT